MCDNLLCSVGLISFTCIKALLFWKPVVSFWKIHLSTTFCTPEGRVPHVITTLKSAAVCFAFGYCHSICVETSAVLSHFGCAALLIYNAQMADCFGFFCISKGGLLSYVTTRCCLLSCNRNELRRFQSTHWMAKLQTP